MNTITLTPAQIRGLKLAKEGDLFPQEANKWTHLNAAVTYARNDRFRERPQKIQFLTTATLDTLRELGLLRSLNPDVKTEEAAHGITMVGKIWLLKNK